jgi:hypothetical protein
MNLAVYVAIPKAVGLQISRRSIVVVSYVKGEQRMRVLCSECMYFKMLPAYGKYCANFNTVMDKTEWCDFGRPGKFADRVYPEKKEWKVQ